MRFYTNLPKEYSKRIWNLSPFNEKGRITQRVVNGLENSLYLYSGLAKLHAEKTDNNPENFAVKEVYVVGSVARENKVYSDMDFLFVCPFIDDVSAENLKLMLSHVLFNDRPKQEAIDIFIRSEDKYPERSSVNITSQVERLINKYNSKL